MTRCGRSWSCWIGPSHFSISTTTVFHGWMSAPQDSVLVSTLGLPPRSTWSSSSQVVQPPSEVMTQPGTTRSVTLRWRINAPRWL